MPDYERIDLMKLVGKKIADIRFEKSGIHILITFSNGGTIMIKPDDIFDRSGMYYNTDHVPHTFTK